MNSRIKTELSLRNNWAAVFTSRRDEVKEKVARKLAEVFSIPEPDALKLLNRTPLLLFDHLSQSTAIRMKRYFSELGAEITITADDVLKKRSARAVWPFLPDFKFLSTSAATPVSSNASQQKENPEEELKGDPKNSPLTTLAPSEIDRLIRQMEQVSKELGDAFSAGDDESRQKKTRYEADIAGWQSAVRDLTRLTLALEEAKKGLEDQNREKAAEIENQEKEHEKLRDRLTKFEEAYTKEIALHEELKKIHADLVEGHNQLKADLETESAEALKWKQETAELAKQLETLEPVKKQLEEKKKRLETSLKKETENARSLSETLEDWKKRMADSQTQIRDLEKYQVELEALLQKARLEAAKTSQRLSEKNSDAEQLKQDLSELNHQKIRLEDGLSQETQQTQKLTENVNALSEKLQNLAQELRETEQAKAMLEGNLTFEKRKSAALQKSLESWQAQAEMSAERVKNLEQIKTGLDEALDQEQQRVKKLETSSEHWKSQAVENSEGLKKLEQVRRGLEQELNLRRQDLNKERAAAEALAEQVETLETKLEHGVRRLEREQRGKQELTVKYESLEEQFARESAEKNEIEKNLSEHQKLLQEAEQNAVQWRIHHERVSAELHTQQQNGEIERSEAASKLAAVQSELSTWKAKSESLEQKIQDFYYAKEKLEFSLREKSEEMDQAGEQLRHAEKEIKELRASLQEKKALSAELQTRELGFIRKVEKLEKAAEAEKQNLSNAKGEHLRVQKKLEGEIRGVRGEIERYEHEIEKLNQENVRLLEVEKQAEILQREKEENGVSRSRLEEELHGTRQEIRAREKEIETLTAEKNRLLEVEKKSKLLQGEKEALIKALDEARGAFQKLAKESELRRGQQGEEQKALSLELEGRRAEVESLVSKLQKLEYDKTRLEKTVQEGSEQAQEFETRLGEAERSREKLRANLDAEEKNRLELEKREITIRREKDGLALKIKEQNEYLQKLEEEHQLTTQHLISEFESIEKVAETRNKELESQRRVYENLLEKNRELEIAFNKETKKKTEVEANQDQLRREKAELEKALEVIRGQLGKLEKDYAAEASSRAESEKTIDMTRRAKDSMTVAFEEMKTQFERLQEMYGRETKSRTESEEKLEAAEREKNTLDRSLKALRTEHEDLKEDFDRMRSRVDEGQESYVVESERWKAKTDRLSDRLKNLEYEKARWEEKNQEQVKEVQQWKVKFDALIQKQADLLENLKDKEIRLQQAKQKEKFLEDEKRAFEAAMKEKKDGVQSRVEEIRILRQDWDSQKLVLTGEIEEKKSAYEKEKIKWERERKELENQKVELEIQLGTVDEEVKRWTSKANKLEGQLRGFQELRENMGAELEGQLGELEKWRNGYQEAVQRMSQMEESLSGERLLREEADRRLSEVQKKKDELEENLMQEQVRNHALKFSLETAEEELEKSRKQAEPVLETVPELSAADYQMSDELAQALEKENESREIIEEAAEKVADLEKNIRFSRRLLRHAKKAGFTVQEKSDLKTALELDYENFHRLKKVAKLAKKSYLRQVAQSAKLFEEWKDVTRPVRGKTSRYETNLLREFVAPVRAPHEVVKPR